MNNNNVKALKLILKSITIIEERLVRKATDKNDYELVPDSINFRIKIIGDCLIRIRNSSNKIFTGIDDAIKSILNQTLIITNNYETVDFKITHKISTRDLPILKQKIQTFLSGNNEAV